jgi:hypothetical protein
MLVVLSMNRRYGVATVAGHESAWLALLLKMVGSLCSLDDKFDQGIYIVGFSV